MELCWIPKISLLFLILKSNNVFCYAHIGIQGPGPIMTQILQTEKNLFLPPTMAEVGLVYCWKWHAK